MRLFREGEFESWWYEECIPQYVYEFLCRQNLACIDFVDRWVSGKFLKRFDIESMNIDTLLFQSGFLTICEARRTSAGLEYRLNYPNIEVRQSFTVELLEHTIGKNWSVDTSKVRKIINKLIDVDATGFQSELFDLLAGIPHVYHDQLKSADYEAWYASNMYVMLSMMGLEARFEEATRFGRSDLVVRLGDKIFVMEYKCGLAKDSESMTRKALQQIIDRCYGDKYRRGGASCYMVAMVFGSDTRNVVQITIEELK